MAITPLSAAVSACTIVQIARSAVVNQLVVLHNRFESARRAIDLLRGLANNSLLPLIPNLPALAEIDLSTYEHIYGACPGLLPPVDAGVISKLPGVAQLEQIRVLYQTAVRDMLNRLESSPLGLIDQLEKELNAQIDKALLALGPVNQFIDCVCAGVDEITNPQNVEIARNFYSELTKKPTLIDEELSGQMNSFRESTVNLKNVVSVSATNA